jgi:uncharacterized membrane protein
MSTTRLEAFSDAVIAIIMTIMVLELKVPHGDNLQALRPLLPIFLSYLLSFVFLGIYWNNHHHMLHATKRVNGKILWANINLLFWLSLVPFTTAWMGENHVAALPTSIYGVILCLSAISYTLLQNLIVAQQGPDSLLAKAVANDVKGKVSLVAYLAGIPLAFVHSGYAIACYVFVAILWLVPDRRIEARLYD